MKLIFRTLSLTILTVLFATAVHATDERTFRVINAANGLADNSAQVIICTKTGRMIISTLGNLNFYDGSSFSHINTRPECQYHLPQYRGNYHIYFDRKHHIWLKNAYTMACVDLQQEQFVEDVDSVIQQVLGCQDVVQDLFTDHAGSIWILTEKGLYSVDRKKYFSVLKDCNLQDVEVYKDKWLLTFYANGEEVGQELSTGHIVHRTRPYDWDDAELYDRTSVLHAYKDDFFQIRNGHDKSILMRFNVDSLKWTTVMELDYYMSNMDLEAGSDVLYVPTACGYWSYNIVTGEKNHFKELKMVSGEKLFTDCNALAFDKQGGMWIGTESRGVLYARPTSSRFTTYSWKDPKAHEYAKMMAHLNQNINEFKGHEANCMYTDSRGWTWFGTTKGVYMYRTPQSEPLVFTKRNGLFNNVVHAVVEDHDHNIWLSTSCGISCIIFEGDKPVFVNSFNQDDNVPNESFVNCKAMCLDDGTIIMQAIDHVVAFNPEDFEVVNGRKPFKLFPKLIRIMVNGNYVSPGKEEDGNVIIDKAISRVTDISLNANQNSVSFTFSGLNYFRALQTFYRARVTGKGINADWRIYSFSDGNGFVDSQGRLHLPLTGLQPGDYKVEVQASMFPDSWLEKPYEWNIHVNQPWWRTTGIIVVLLVVLLALLCVNFYFYNRNVKMRARRNNQEGDMIKKIRSFVDHCYSYSGELIAPLQEDLFGNVPDQQRNLSPQFSQLMIKLLPYVRQHMTGDLTISQLSKAAGVDIVELYNTISGNLYKSPRELVMIMRLHKAAELLINSDKTIEQVAADCGFYTPNYFMGNFFHEYKLTPTEYREERKTE